MEEGSNHTAYRHPRFPQLKSVVARHGTLATGYAQDALSVIDELKRLEAEEEERKRQEEQNETGS